MNDDLTSPISGEAVPYKDLGEETTSDLSALKSENTKKKNNPKKLMLIAAGVLVFIIVILSIAVALKKNKKSNVLPTPISSPQASEVPEKETYESELGKKVQILEKKLETMDTEELELNFPVLDWGIKIE